MLQAMVSWSASLLESPVASILLAELLLSEILVGALCALASISFFSFLSLLYTIFGLRAFVLLFDTPKRTNAYITISREKAG